MSIKINHITRNSDQLIQQQLPSIKIGGLSTQKGKVKISAMTDMENIPGPDRHTHDNVNVGHYDEFHFLKSIIIDNELY